MVGIAGLEPATSRPPDARATRLRYIPIKKPSETLVCGLYNNEIKY